MADASISTRSNWIVLKFGGTSVSSKKTWETIIKQISCLLEENEQVKVWVVVSALSKVTNRLLKCIEEINMFNEHVSWIKQKHYDLASALGDSTLCDEKIEKLFIQLEKLLGGIELTGDTASSRLRARVLSFGELLSSTIGYNILKKFLDNEVGKDLSWVDARKCLFASDIPSSSPEDKYLNANIAPRVKPSAAEAQLSSSFSRVAITQGFIASTNIKNPVTCVLSRGGGDVSGGLFACLLNAKRYEVWTDVHGLFTSDPRQVKKARHILELSYREAQELAAMGARVLHPRSLIPAAFNEIPVEIHNTMDFANRHKCTKIVSPSMLKDKDTTVMAIAKRTDQVLVTLSTVDMAGVSGFMSKAFAPFDRHGVSVDLVACSQYSVSVTLDYIPGGVEGDSFAAVISDLEKVAQVDVHEKCAVVSIVGRRLRTVLHHMADAFKELARYNVLLLSESSEDLNLSFVVEQKENIDELVSNLHRVLLEEKRGLPSPRIKGSFFGTTLPQLLKVTPTTPGFTASQGEGIIPPLDLNGFTVKQSAKTDNCTRFSNELDPLCLIDTKQFFDVVSKLKYYSLSFDKTIKVLKLVACINPSITFVVSSQNDENIMKNLQEVSKLALRIEKNDSSQVSSILKAVSDATLAPSLSSCYTLRTLELSILRIDKVKKKILLNACVTSSDVFLAAVKCFSFNIERKCFEPSKNISHAENEKTFDVFTLNNDSFSEPILIFKALFINKELFPRDKIRFSDRNNFKTSLGEDIAVEFN